MKTKDGESKIDMKVKCNFIGYESIQSETGIGANNNRWDYAQSYGELMGMMTKNVERLGDLAQDKLKNARNALGASANPGYCKETDVHWFVTQEGKGTFNYRMVWPCVYNTDKIGDKPMRLQVGVYDQDVGKDDLIGELTLDIAPMLKEAFKNRERNRFIQVAQPFRIAEGAARDWKLNFDIKKDNQKQGEITLSLEVMDHMISLLKPAGEGRSEPNQHPMLAEPLRRMPWDEKPPAQMLYCGGLCGGGGSQENMGN